MQQKLKTIGIVGGGQLGRMICFEAHKMGFKTVVFCDQNDSSASFVTNKTIIADYKDQIQLEKFANQVDVVTFEFENIPYQTINFINQKVPVYPNPEVLRITQDRILEKTFLQKIGVTTTDFLVINSLSQLREGFNKFKKSILKTATLGYDGKGQYIIKDDLDIDSAWQNFKNISLILEKFCAFDIEISVIAARSVSGEVKTYEPVYNQHLNSILDKTIYPAPIAQELKIKAQEIAKKIAKELNLVGVLAVEFFVANNQLLVNELAPRPHNSGHITMDLCITSQFEQLIKAITNIKLGDCSFYAVGHMQNLVGNQVLDLNKFYQNDKTKVHLYGKNEVKEGRKMGHVNIIEKLLN